MDALKESFSLTAAVVGAIIAALGYVGKLAVDTLQELKRSRQERRSRLVELQSLLRASKAAFEVQQQNARRLLEMLSSRNVVMNPGDGYEKNIAGAYPTLTNDEKELHQIIRGITVYALNPTNTAMLKWIQSDQYFRGQQRSGPPFDIFPERLSELQTHLLLWLAKYETWIPNHPEHTLIYLADEEAHGVEFPHGIDGIVDELLKHS